MRPILRLPLWEFCRAVKTNRIFADLEMAFRERTGGSVSLAERDSWHGSLPRLSGLLELCELPGDVLVGLEVQIPYYSERIDAAVYSHDAIGQPSVVLIELKQWSEVERGTDERLIVRMRHGPVAVVHPSLQVDGYRRHLKNFVKAFHATPGIQIACCVYAHNYPTRDGALFESVQGSDDDDDAPIFGATDIDAMILFMRERTINGKGIATAELIQSGGLTPSRRLIEDAGELIRDQNVFTMLDEQIPAQKSIVTAIDRAIRLKSKSIIVIDGGPGTGKSVIALDALGHALRRKQSVFFASGSAAFTYGLRRLLGSDLAPLVRFTDFFWQHPEDSVDVLIIDEAHRVRSKSLPKVISEKRPKISQLEELIHAAKVTVLFMDTNQIIGPDEIGQPANVIDIAQRKQITLSHHRLHSQFRCDGSDVYLQWVDGVFALGSEGVEFVLDVPRSFDFGVVDSPTKILEWVQAKNVSEPNSARLVAGWCWQWSDPCSDGTLVEDIRIGDFAYPWELKNGKRGKPGIPEAKYWAVDPLGADQAGTVYSVQGFEFGHVGVIMGPDLVVRDGNWIANPKYNFRNNIRGKSSDVASIYLRRIYRTLFTRPLKSIRVYSVDEETRDFLRSRLTNGV